MTAALDFDPLHVLEQIAPGAVGPALASAVVFTAAALVARATKRPSIAAAGTALAVVSGFAVGFQVVVGRWPSLPLAPGTDAVQWVAWFAVGGWVLGLLELASPRVPRPVRYAVRLAAGLGASWLLVEPLIPHALSLPEAWLRAGLAAVVVTGLWTVAAEQARSEESPGFVALPFAVSAGMAAAVFAFLAGSLSMGQVTGGLSAALGAALLLGLLWKIPATSPATAPVAALVLGGQLLGAFAYLNYGEVVYFPWTSALLLAGAAPLGTYLSRWVRRRGRKAAVATLAGALPPVACGALAAWIAYASAPPPNPYA